MEGERWMRGGMGGRQRSLVSVSASESLLVVLHQDSDRELLYSRSYSLQMSEEIWERLHSCEYPFRWGLDALNSSKLSVLDEMKEKDEEVKKGFFLSVTRAYKLGVSGRWAESREELDQVIMNCDDWILDHCKGYLHILNATAAHVALKEGQTERAKELIDGVKDFDDLSKEDQSAVWAFKAKVFLEYGIEGEEKALEWADKAVEYRPAKADWNSRLGKLEGRMRHRRKGPMPPPSDKEMRALETAHAVRPTSTTAVYLAAALVDRARAGGDPTSSDNVRAFSLYKEALKAGEEEDNSDVVIRCAMGFTKLPPRFGGTGVARGLFERALQMAPENAMLNHQLGLLNARMEQLDEAVKYLKTSEEGDCLPAGLTLLEVLVLKDPEGEGSPASLEEHYKRLEEKYLEDELRASIHFHAASFHLTVTRDLERVVYHVTKALDSTTDPSRFRISRCKWKPSVRAVFLNVFGETWKMLVEALRLRDTGGVEREVVEALLRRIPDRPGGGGERGQYGTVRIEGRSGGSGGREGGGWRPRDPHHPPNQSSSTWRDKRMEQLNENWRSEPRNRACEEDGPGKPNTWRGGTSWRSPDRSD